MVHTRRTGGEVPATALYAELSGRLVERLGEGRERASAHTAATRDGKGIVFVAYDGEVYPAGFLPLGLGSVRDQPLAEIYRDHPTLTAIRAARVQRSVRGVRVRRPVRWVPRPRLRVDRRPARRGRRVHPPARCARAGRRSRSYSEQAGVPPGRRCRLAATQV